MDRSEARGGSRRGGRAGGGRLSMSLWAAVAGRDSARAARPGIGPYATGGVE